MSVTIGIGISTTGNNIISLQRAIESLNQQSIDQLIIVLQNPDTQKYFEIRELCKVIQSPAEIIRDSRRGLSKSRNLALRHLKTTHVVLTDDDVIFDKNAIRSMREALEAYPEDSVLTFQISIIGSQKKLRNYRQKPYMHSWRSIMSVCSIEIVYPRRLADFYGFDERFGLGALYPSGEENILLSDILKSGYKIYSIPVIIAAHQENTSNSNLDNDRLSSKGTVFWRMFGPLGVPIIFIFILAKAKRGKIITLLRALIAIVRFNRGIDKNG